MRAFLACLVIAIVAAAAAYLANEPGTVAIAWRDVRLEPSVPVLVAALIVLFLVALLAVGVLRRLIAGPGALLKARRERRRRAGYHALTQGMVAVAAGDAEEAQRQARKADVLLAEPPLTLLLSAQAAQLGGDEGAARKYFSEMLNRPETEFLGLRGLLMQALRAGDDATALRLVERARALRPKTPWVLTNLLLLQARAGKWEGAQATLVEAVKAKLLPAPVSRRHQAVLLTLRSRAASANGDAAAALPLAAKAQDLAPDFAPAAAERARLLHAAGRDRAAAKAIETAWRQAPQPLLAASYGAIYAEEAPLVRVNRFEALAGSNPGHVESHLAVAEAALAAQLWGEARRHLQAAGAGDPESGDALPARLCRLMASLEEGGHGDGAAVRAWLARAAAAPPDPTHVCAVCAAESQDWQALCPRCRGFDTLEWRVPSRTAPALPGAAVAGAVVSGAVGALTVVPGAGEAAFPAPPPAGTSIGSAPLAAGASRA
jgi:HemY protein